MQKKLIALAIAGLASTAAFAQTNVTVYGVADGTFDYVWVDDSNRNVNTFTPAGVPVSSSSQEDNYDGNTRVTANSSYLGFKGTEDLGNGLKAVFQYEIGFDFTSGASLGGARDSFVGLSSNVGTLVLGNLTGPTRAMGAALDVNPGATGIGANSAMIGKLSGSTLKNPLANSGLYTTSAATGATVIQGPDLGFNCTEKGGTCTSLFDTRWSNAIAYISPNIAGFTAVGAYVANENKTKDFNPITNAQTAQARDTTGYDLGLKWEGMGFMAGVAYNAAEIGDEVGDIAVNNIRVGGMYSTGMFSVRAMWEQTELDTNQNLGLDNKQQKWGVGGTFTMGKATLLGQFYQALESSEGKDDGGNFWTLGATYSLSKRTMLKATYAMVDNDDNAAFDFGVGASGQGSAATTINSTNGNITEVDTGFGSKIQGFQVGVRHSF